MSIERPLAAAFDLDGTLLRPPDLFDRSIHAELDTPVDWVRQEVLEELRDLHGSGSSPYVTAAVRYYLADNSNRRGHTDLLTISRAGRYWPSEEDYFTFTTSLVGALHQQNYALYGVTHAPQFLAHSLLVEDGVPTAYGTAHFTDVIGSTYEVTEQGTLNGRAYRPRDKAEELAARGLNIAVAAGDTLHDLPMLRIARLAIAMCPSPELRAAAEQEGMTIVDESDNEVTITGSHSIRTFRANDIRDMHPDQIIQLVHAA
jgi:phosphoserine phosphatase